MNNSTLPNFSTLKPALLESIIKEVLAQNRAALKTLLAQADPFTWRNLYAPMEALDDAIDQLWSPASHLHSVMSNADIRGAYQACLPLLSDYHTELTQNTELYHAIQTIADGDDFSSLSQAQRKAIENDLRDFTLNGVSLDAEKKQRYKVLKAELSQLTNHFSENVLDATDAWSKLITNESELAGIPKPIRLQAKAEAKKNGQDGWRLTLDEPCYVGVMMYSTSRSLRAEIYTAFVTRASDQGPYAKEWDNTQIMETILEKRAELSTLLGFNNFPEYSLATHMVKHPKDVLAFLNDLVEQALPHARQEFQELTTYAETQGESNLQAWDLAYYSEKLRLEKHEISQEALRPYFPIDHVLTGLFSVLEKLYGLRVNEITHFDTWHESVRLFELFDEQDQLRGRCYMDLYARRHKRGGAWMDECINRRRLADHTLQTPIAHIVCNFNPGNEKQPALLTHDDVLTLFHECGHALQHILTQIDTLGVAGINGVEWDAVELPSQFMENFCWQYDVVQQLSFHYETGEQLPESLLQRLIASRNFQSGMRLIKQLEYSLFDFRVHLEYDATQNHFIQQLLDTIRESIAMMPVPAFNRFQHSFTHIFAGGYAAGYYSYLWAEVLSSDAFASFEEQGIFNRQTGRAFLENILETGGSRDALDLFIAFRGREPQIDALLRHRGLGYNRDESSSL